MSKAVLISIQPKWCELISSGKKTVEVRKTKPKLATPFKCYIYETRAKTDRPIMLDFGGILDYHGRGKIIGEFVCDSITYLGNIATDPWEYLNGGTHTAHKRLVAYNACMTESECITYGGQYAWHISELKIYDKPKDLSEFYTECDMGCEDCDYWKSVRVNADEFDMECDSGMHGHKPIKRAPQSWCYVEEEQSIWITESD